MWNRHLIKIVCHLLKLKFSRAACIFICCLWQPYLYAPSNNFIKWGLLGLGRKDHRSSGGRVAGEGAEKWATPLLSYPYFENMRLEIFQHLSYTVLNYFASSLFVLTNQSYYIVFFFHWCRGLNSPLHACKAGAYAVELIDSPSPKR